MSFDFFENEQAATLTQASRHPSISPDAGAFENFWSGAGHFSMRSLAEAGRAVDMAGAAFPVAYDSLVGGTEQQDRYFKEHDEVFNSAVDHWTPRPGEVGMAGQIAGQLAGGIMQAVVSPALLVGTTQLSSAEDLVRQGVDATTANQVGAVQGAATAVGVKLPAFGSTLTRKILTGAGGNLAQGVAASGTSRAILEHANAAGAAAQYDPFDFRARALDVMLGAAFGGIAHLGKTHEKLTAQEDYKAFLSEYGLSESIVKSVSENGVYHPLPPGTALELKSSDISGLGMFSTKGAKPGEVLAPATIDGVGTQAARYTNHSNEANAEYRRNANGDVDLVAIAPIRPGSEVVSNYRTSADVFGFSGLKKLSNLTPTEEAALLVANQARHIEDRAPGIPATDVDATMHAKAMQEAIGQVLRGDEVSVDHITKDIQTDTGEAWAARHADMQAELQRLINEGPAHDPIIAPPKPGAAVNLTENDLARTPNAMKARTTAMDNPDMLIHTGETAPDGSLVTMNAHDAIAQADAQVTLAKSTAQQVFMTAAHCLLGAI